MNALDQVNDYLHSKISRVNVDNPKANLGGKILKRLDWEERLEYLVNQSLSILQFQFTRTNKETEAGRAQLTATSSMIGLHILATLDPMRFDDDASVIDKWKDYISVGDVFIEAYKVEGLIRLEYSQTRDGSYTVVATERWLELKDIPISTVRTAIVGTVLNKPEPISRWYQEFTPLNNEPRVINVVKGQSERLDLQAPWVQAINKLQQVGWRINKRVLKAMLANKDLFVSDKPYDNEAKELKRISKTVEWEFITKKAEILVHADKFYQFLEADYRGRLYYSEPFLNFQGSDLSRGIMKFQVAKAMTTEGLQWLAIHTAASYNMSYNIDEIPDWCQGDYVSHLKAEGLDNISVDKMTLEDRIQWCNEYMDEIIEAGTTHGFAMDAEKPVTFLACCIEWADYAAAVEAGRTHYTSLPVPIDGSNNGWQHLGAMSKDPHTGNLVGLVPIEIQQDFYVQTAKELINLTDDERLSNLLSSMPMKHIRKGISKRGSMTRAYSAGASKIGENMWFDCRTEDFHEKYGITEEDCMKLAKVLVKAINNVCPGPLETMGYLQDLASYMIGKYKKTDDGYELQYGKGDKHLSWTTPSGFKVKYENWIYLDVKQRNTIDGKQIKHVARLASDRPDVRGFMCGISPNFVHSMDAAHMANVINIWTEDFCAVHDSFATHAPDVADLVELTKDVFIDMYDHENFFDVIREEITNTQDFCEQPEIGTLNIKEIKNSDYFFA